MVPVPVVQANDITVATTSNPYRLSASTYGREKRDANRATQFTELANITAVLGKRDIGTTMGLPPSTIYVTGKRTVAAQSHLFLHRMVLQKKERNLAVLYIVLTSYSHVAISTRFAAALPLNKVLSC